MLHKTTTRLFRGTYQYKIVLVCSNAHYFRSGDMQKCLELIQKSSVATRSRHSFSYFINQEDKNYALELQSVLSNLTDTEVRVETPWISIYSNNKADIDLISKIDVSKVKYISQPSLSGSLTTNTVIMPKMNYDYRVTLGKTTQPNYSFIEWAENSPKCKLTKSCTRDLQRPRSWGGTHFYITGDNNLLLAKMHLGGSIAKVERIVKA